MSHDRKCVKCESKFEPKDWKDVVCPTCRNPLGSIFDLLGVKRPGADVGGE